MHDSPDLVINWTEIWTVCRPQIWRNEVWCFSMQNLHSFTRTFTLVLVLQGNLATKLSYGGNTSFLLWAISFWFRHWKNFKNRPTFAKVTVKIKVAQFFWLTVYTWLCHVKHPSWRRDSRWWLWRPIQEHRCQFWLSTPHDPQPISAKQVILVFSSKHYCKFLYIVCTFEIMIYDTCR